MEDEKKSFEGERSFVSVGFEVKDPETKGEGFRSGSGPETKDSDTDEVPALDNKDLFPEGGWQANIVLLGSFCGMVASLAFLNSAGVLRDYINENILVEESASTIGWIFSINSFIEFALLIVVGPLFDRVGARIPLIFGAILSGVGFLCTSWCSEMYQFILSYSILGGVGSSFVFCLNIGVLSHWYLKKRGQAIGISYIGGALGGALFPVMYRSLLPTLGFGWTVRIGAFIVIALLIVSIVLIKDRRHIIVSAEAKEVDIDGTTRDRDSLLVEVLKSVDVRVFADKVYTCLVLSLLGHGFAFLVSQIYLPSYAVAHGHHQNQAYLLILVFNSLSIPGRVIPGIIADKVGRFNVLCIICASSTLAIAIIWTPPPIGGSLTGLYIYSAVYGFTSGSILSLSPTCVGQISQTKDFAKRTGTAFFVFSLGDLIGIPVAGAIVGTHNLSKGYENMVVFVLVSSVVGTIGAFVSRYLYGGFKLIKL